MTVQLDDGSVAHVHLHGLLLVRSGIVRERMTSFARGLVTPTANETGRDPYQVLDDLTAAAEALCPTGPHRHSSLDNGDFLLWASAPDATNPLSDPGRTTTAHAPGEHAGQEQDDQAAAEQRRNHPLQLARQADEIRPARLPQDPVEASTGARDRFPVSSTMKASPVSGLTRADELMAGSLTPSWPKT